MNQRKNEYWLILGILKSRIGPIAFAGICVPGSIAYRSFKAYSAGISTRRWKLHSLSASFLPCLRSRLGWTMRHRFRLVLFFALSIAISLLFVARDDVKILLQRLRIVYRRPSQDTSNQLDSTRFPLSQSSYTQSAPRFAKTYIYDYFTQKLPNIARKLPFRHVPGTAFAFLATPNHWIPTITCIHRARKLGLADYDIIVLLPVGKNYDRSKAVPEEMNKALEILNARAILFDPIEIPVRTAQCIDERETSNFFRTTVDCQVGVGRYKL